MSVVGEIALAAGIVAGVAAVISAYRDGGSILHNVKKKRIARRAPPPPRLLEDSINQAPDDIERERARGISRFGPAFEKADCVAIITIQQIAIQIQGSFLEKLRIAAANDEAADFMALLNDADMGRDGTIRALLELQQRLLQAASIIDIPIATPRTPQQIGMVSEAGLSTAQFISVTPAAANFNRPRIQDNQGHDTTETEVLVSSTRHRFNFPGFKKHRETQPNELNQYPELRRNGAQRVYTLPTSPRIGRIGETSSPDRPRNDSQTSGFTYEAWEDNPAEIWGTRSTRTSTYIPADITPTPMSRSSTWNSTASASSYPHPTPANNYLGYCKGAWRLHNGDTSSMAECRDYAQSAQSKVKFLRCTGCKFEGHFDPRTIWHRVWMFDPIGIKMRWSFLAKSHVRQKSNLDRQSAKECAFGYQCLFCVFSGLQAPILQGVKEYIQHIDQHHRGRDMSDVVLDRTCCINDRVCGDDEDFDINLFPLS